MARASIGFSSADYRVEVGGAREQAYEPRLSNSDSSGVTATTPTGANGTFSATAVAASPIPTCAIWQIRQAVSCRLSSCPCAVISRKKTNKSIASPNASGMAKRFKRRCSVAFVPSFDSNAKYSRERNLFYPLGLRCVFPQYGSKRNSRTSTPRRSGEPRCNLLNLTWSSCSQLPRPVSIGCSPAPTIPWLLTRVRSCPTHSLPEPL
jgi:hypothetical protein